MVKAFSKFSSYIFLKWICIYSYLFIENGSRWKWSQQTNSEGLLLAVFMLLALPLLELVVLIWPFEFALKKRGWQTAIILLLTFVLEFLLTWYATNQQIATWIIVKIVFSVIIYLFLYRKQLTEKTQKVAFLE